MLVAGIRPLLISLGALHLQTSELGRLGPKDQSVGPGQLRVWASKVGVGQSCTAVFMLDWDCRFVTGQSEPFIRGLSCLHLVQLATKTAALTKGLTHLLVVALSQFFQTFLDPR